MSQGSPSYVMILPNGDRYMTSEPDEAKREENYRAIVEALKPVE